MQLSEAQPSKRSASALVRFDRLAWLLLLLGPTLVLDGLFYGAIGPLLPFYADEFQLSKSTAGLVVAAYSAGMLLASPVAGWLSARAGAKVAVVLGLALLSVASLVFGLSSNDLVLGLSRFVQGAGAAFAWIGALSWLVGAAPVGRRAEVIGIALGLAVAGAMLGPVVGATADSAGPSRVFAALAGCSALLAVVVARNPAPHGGATWATKRLRSCLASPRVWAGIGLIAVPGLFAGLLGLLAPLQLERLGASAAAIGLVFLVAAGVEAGASPVGGWFADRRGRLQPIRFGLVVAAVLALTLPWAKSIWLIAALVGSASVAFGALWAPAIGLVADGAEATGADSGPAVALSNMAFAASHMTGAAGGGRLAEAVGDPLPYALLAGLCLITVTVSLRGPSGPWTATLLDRYPLARSSS